MKKTGILLTVLLVLGIAVVAYAGAIKVSLHLDPDPDHAGALEDPAASGFGIVIRKEQGGIAQFQVRRLMPGKEYWVYGRVDRTTLFFYIGKLTMNNSGSGHLHDTEENVPPGEYWFGVSDMDPRDMTEANRVLIMASPVTL